MWRLILGIIMVTVAYQTNSQYSTLIAIQGMIFLNTGIGYTIRKKSLQYH